MPNSPSLFIQACTFGDLLWIPPSPAVHFPPLWRAGEPSFWQHDPLWLGSPNIFSWRKGQYSRRGRTARHFRGEHILIFTPLQNDPRGATIVQTPSFPSGRSEYGGWRGEHIHQHDDPESTAIQNAAQRRHLPITTHDSPSRF